MVRAPAGEAALGPVTADHQAVLFAADESGIRVKPVTRRPEPSRRMTYDRIESIERYQDRVSVGKYAGVGAAIGAGVMLVLLGMAAQGY